MSKQLLRPPLFPSLRDEREFASLLLSVGVRHVAVSFSGAGDSGEVDSVGFYQDSPQDDRVLRRANVADTVVPCPAFLMEQVSPRRRSATDRTDQERLKTIILALFNLASDRAGEDWYNNEGGFGRFVVTVLPHGGLDVSFDVSVYVRETEDYEYDMAWPVPDEGGE